MTKSDKATALFAQGFSCSQSVLAAFSEEFGLSEDDCLRISCAFGAGMGRRQLTCGAVTGALMVLGMKYGRAKGEDVSKKLNTYKKTTEFFEEFRKKHGSTDCKDLLQGLDMNNPEDLKKIEELNLFLTTCYNCVTNAVEILESIMANEPCETD
ncbi:MAG: C-GCAxxG-C-C family protein [Bacteroidales bacterium]